MGSLKEGNMNINDRIKIRREILGLSQDDLAKKMGYRSRTTIAKIEAGINDITQSKVIKLAKALDTSPAYLMGWEEPLEPTEEELELMRLYRKLQESDKKFAKALVQKLLGVDGQETDEGEK